MLKAQVINIQRFSIHDGDGIRTVIFFKGCPLSCLWCHNPESHSYAPQLLYNREKCNLCLACIDACPAGRIYYDPQANSLKESAVLCSACGACAEACLNGAREIAGKAMSVEQIMAELDKDSMFYEQSGGGVTLSGGEVMAGNQDFLLALLQNCHERGYSVNIDTSGHAPYDNFRRVLEYVDTFLYDIKLMDPNKHQQYTGISNELILENLVKLSATAKIYIRLPLVEGINSNDAEIKAIIKFLRPLDIERVYFCYPTMTWAVTRQ